ncbi:MAG: hypothetical protein WC477_00075 [Patescibacteria group bacterium]
MLTDIVISRFSNLLFYIQRTGKCSPKKFDLEKYISEDNIDVLFYGKNEKIIWKRLQKSIGREQMNRFQQVVKPLKLTFTSYWKKESKTVLKWKKYFQMHTTEINGMLNDSKKLCGIKHLSFSNVPIYLLSDPSTKSKEINAWFSWTPKESFMVVEIPFGLQPSKNHFPIAVLCHEFFHLLLRKNQNLHSRIKECARTNSKFLTKIIDNGMPEKMFLEEVLLSSFLPEGYLSEKHLGIKINQNPTKPKDLLDWRRHAAFELKNVVKRYIEKGYVIDQKYLTLLINTLKAKK